MFVGWSGLCVRRALLAIALAGLGLGLIAAGAGRSDIAQWLWAAGTAPVVAGLAVSMIGDLLAGRLGVDAVALVSMSAALVLGQPLAGVVVAIMYAGGNLLEDFAVARAERDLRALVDRAPRLAHRQGEAGIEDVAIEDVVVGDRLLVRAGEVVPVDGFVLGEGATLDEAALTGEPIPVIRRAGENARSGVINVGDTFALRASATAGESTYAGIVRMATAAQTAKAPFVRLADRYALILLPVTLLLAGGAWLWSGDPIRGLAVLVTSTPCPLILAAPVAFIAGVSRAARIGVLIKGGGPLEALARTHTVMFDKTGTMTVGGARLLAIETAPGQDAQEVLRLAASLEQASHHVVAAAIVSAASARGLALTAPLDVREEMGSGLEGTVDNKFVKAGSAQIVCGPGELSDWASRALRRASWRSALSVFVSVDGSLVGALILADEIRKETPRAIQELRRAGVKRIAMITGDRADSANTIGAALDLDEILSERGPADKVEAVAFERQRHPAVMVGDGINDAPALAAATVGVAMGARGASASSEAADVVLLVDRLDRVADAVAIARRALDIATQSIVAGMALSGLAMAVAAVGWLTPIQGALTQEAIDVAVILNALRALTSPLGFAAAKLPPAAALALHQSHEKLGPALDRLREIADALDDAPPDSARALIEEAQRLVAERIVKHENDDESAVYPRISKYLRDPSLLAAMSRAHREILHSARLLSRLSSGLRLEPTDRYVVRDAQRVIESIESLVRIHSAQEEDIYEGAARTL
jgi:heavy metal translocating P-type ATPase